MKLRNDSATMVMYALGLTVVILTMFWAVTVNAKHAKECAARGGEFQSEYRWPGLCLRPSAMAAPSTASVVSKPKPTDNLISFSNGTREVASIRRDGRFYLNGREVHTDREYREVMMRLMNGLMCLKPEAPLAAHAATVTP